MSGGHYDYAYLSLESAASAIEKLDTFKKMEQELRLIGKHDVADEIFSFILLVETAKRRIEIAGRRLEDLMMTIEWAFSSDVSFDDIDSDFENLTRKK